MNLSIINILLAITPSFASPLCYIIDNTGKRISLDFVCNSSNSTAKPTKTTVTPPPPPTATNPNTPTTPATNTATPETKEEVDRSKLPPVQRAIPLIQQQRTPETTTNQ